MKAVLAEGSTRSSSARRTARPRSHVPGRSEAADNIHIRPRLAVVCLVRAHQARSARGSSCVGGGNTGDGLLPHRPPFGGRTSGNGDRPFRLREMKASPWEKEDAMG